MIETFHSIKPLMNYSFPLRLPEISLFPTMSSRRCFRILVQEIQETPEHRPDASRFFILFGCRPVNIAHAKSPQDTLIFHFVFLKDYAPIVSNNTLSISVQMKVLVYSDANTSMGTRKKSIYQQTIQSRFQDYIV
jgi:hypothetical protein